MKTPLVLGLYTLFISGCSSTQYIKQADLFGHNGRATLVTKDRGKVKIMGASKIKNSLVFKSFELVGNLDTIPLADVVRLTVKKQGIGALKGAGAGFGIGFVSLMMLGGTTCNSDDILGCDGGVLFLGSILGGVIFGVPIGAFTGAIVGDHTHYVFGDLPVLDTSKTITKPQRRGVHHRRIKR